MAGRVDRVDRPPVINVLPPAIAQRFQHLHRDADGGPQLLSPRRRIVARRQNWHVTLLDDAEMTL